MSRQRVLLISRFMTQNACNEALTRYATESLPNAEVRAQSPAVTRRIGLPAERIQESPDLMFLALRQPSQSRGRDPNGPIGLAINRLESLAGTDEWKPFMQGLRRLSRALLFFTNAINRDRESSRHLAELAGCGDAVTHQPSYEALRRHFGKCRVLVSSRLHSSILALCEGVPFVSIDISDHMGYPFGNELPPLTVWSKRVLENIPRCPTAEVTQLSAATANILERHDGAGGTSVQTGADRGTACRFLKRL